MEGEISLNEETMEGDNDDVYDDDDDDDDDDDGDDDVVLYSAVSPRLCT